VARVSRADTTADGNVLELSNETWTQRGVTHVRRCVVGANSVDVIDEIDAGQHASLEVHVHWLLPENAPSPEITSDGGGRLDIVRAEVDSVMGWRALRYGEKQAATSVTYVTRVTGHHMIRSRFLATNLPTTL